MTFEVFSYWNMQELQLVFNAVAAIVGSGDFLGLLRTLALVGCVSMAMAVLAGLAQAPDFGRWIIMLAIFNGMLLVPKVTVVLTDETGTQGQITVANVPIGLAEFASSMSHIGYYLTRTFETAFTVIPTDLQFSQHGALWGQRVQREMLHTQFSNSIMQSNLLEFYRQCIVPEYATGYIVASDMAQATDLWAYLNGKTNPGRLVTIRAINGSSPPAGTYGCDVAYGYLTTQANDQAKLETNSLGNRLFPGSANGAPNPLANAAVRSSIQTSTNFILSVSTAATTSIRQTAMTNFMIDAQYMLPAQIGDAAGAAANLAEAQAIRSTSDSYKLMATLAESTMPKVKNIVEIMQYSIFPILALFLMLCGHKAGGALKMYVQSLFWVQLWPPLYAILNMVMMMHSQDLASMTAGQGLAMADYSILNNAYISDQAIAGMIAATAIPAIASAIVKGGDVGAQAIAGMVSPSREADKVASSIASGNISMGNGSLDNTSSDNNNQFQDMARPTNTQGGWSNSGSDGIKHSYYGGHESVDDSARAQNTAMKMDVSGRIGSSLATSATQAEKASFTESVQAGNSIVAAEQAFTSFEQGHGKDRNAQHADQTSTAAQTISSFATEKGLANEATKSSKLSSDQKAEVEAHARAEVTGGVHVPFVGGAEVSAGGGTSASSSSTTQQMNQLLDKLTHNKKYADAVQKTNSAMHSDSFTQGDASTVKAASAIRASLDESKSHVEASQASHEKSRAFQVAATQTKEAGVGRQTDEGTRFMNWAQTQLNSQTGKNYTPTDIADMARYGDAPVLGLMADRYAKGLAEDIERGLGGPPVNDVAARYEEDKGKVPGEEAVRSQDNKNQAAVQHKQNEAGVNTNTGPVNNVSGNVQHMLGDADTQINLGNSSIDSEGKPIQDAAVNNTDPSKGSNLLRATANALPSVLGSDAAALVDKTVGLPKGADAAQAVADKNTGTLGENIVGTAVDVGLTLGGGALGKVGGKAAEGVFKLGKEARIAAEATTREVDDVAKARLAENTATKGEGAAAHAPIPEAAITPEAEKAAADGAAKEAAAFEKKVANDGAKALVETTKTTAGSGQTVGLVAGAEIAHVVTGGNEGVGATPVVKAVEKKGDEALDAVIAAKNEAVPDVQSAVTAVEKTSTDTLNAVVPAIQSTVAGVGTAIQNTNTEVLDAAKDLAGKANDLGNKVADSVMPSPTPKAEDKR